jgi:polysaccharide biosynthesis protein PslG
MRHRVLISVCALLLTLATAGAAAASAPTRVPQGFAGVALERPVWPAPQSTLDRQLDLMVADGVESVRPEIAWADVQPYASWSDVPAAEQSRFTNVNGLPLDLADLDMLVSDCAKRGIAVEPVVADAPSWDAEPPVANSLASTPVTYGPYGQFLKALIARYGPHGSLWNTGVPRLPIRRWQVWNEPNLSIFWANQPNYAPSYVALLKVAHDAIKSADPGASVVLAGLTNSSWLAVAKILKVRGAARLFDVAAAHPYTHNPAGVITILKFFRSALDHGGARGRPIVVDEFGWNSSLGHSPQHYGFETTEQVQASNIGQTISKLGRYRTSLHLAGFDYYDWAGVESDGGGEFQFAGLLKYVNGVFVGKPALAAYRHGTLGLERCRQKATDARRCARRA